MSSSIINDEYYFDEDSEFRELPESAQQMIGDRLMPDEQWKQVGDSVGFSAVDIETLDATQSKCCPAARQMLRQWSRRNGTTLRILRQTFSDLGRNDLVAVIDDIRKYRCKLYCRIQTKCGREHHVDFSVEGRKSLCLAATAALINFADNQHSGSLCFQLLPNVNKTWLTESHRFQGQEINIRVSTYRMDDAGGSRLVGDRLRLLDNQTLIVTENTSRGLTRQMSCPVQETELPSNETPVKKPIQFQEGDRVSNHEVLRQELDVLPGYHRNVNNRSSEIKAAMRLFRDIDGAYIVRSFFNESDPQSLEVALCVMYQRRVKHYHIHQRPDELSSSGKRYYLYPGDFHAATIQELLHHYTTHYLIPRSRPAPVVQNDRALMELKLSRAI